MLASRHGSCEAQLECDKALIFLAWVLKAYALFG